MWMLHVLKYLYFRFIEPQQLAEAPSSLSLDEKWESPQIYECEIVEDNRFEHSSCISTAIRAVMEKNIFGWLIVLFSRFIWYSDIHN